MALVLVGANSYSVVYTDEAGVKRRSMVKNGQSIDALPLSDSELEELKSAYLMSGLRKVPVFVEVEGWTNGHHGRHMQGGTIGNMNIKAQKAAEVEALAAVEITEPEVVPVEKTPTPSIVVIQAEAVVEEVPVEEVPVEEVKAEVKTPVQAKKAKKSKK